MTGEIKDLAVTNLSLEPELQHSREELINLAKEQNQLKQKYVETQSKLSEYHCNLRILFNPNCVLIMRRENDKNALLKRFYLVNENFLLVFVSAIKYFVVFIGCILKNLKLFLKT